MYYLCSADTTTKFYFGKNKQMFRLGFRGETFLYITYKKATQVHSCKCKCVATLYLKKKVACFLIASENKTRCKGNKNVYSSKIKRVFLGLRRLQNRRCSLTRCLVVSLPRHDRITFSTTIVAIGRE